RAHRHPGPVRRLRPGARVVVAAGPAQARRHRRGRAGALLDRRAGGVVCRADREPGAGDRCWRHPEPAARPPEGAAARGIDLGPRLADLGAQVVSWIGSSAFGLVGTATRLALNLTISLFGLFYLLLQPGET